MAKREIAFRDKASVAVCVALAAMGGAAADLYTGFRERTEVNVAEGSTVQHAGLMLQSAESAVNKTGTRPLLAASRSQLTTTSSTLRA